MIDKEYIASEIVKKLKPLNPSKIVLFGSYAYGSPTEKSDIDVYVVTQDDFIPETWREKMDIKLPFSQALRDLKAHYDIDLIAHTKKMHQKFVELNSTLSREIQTKGHVIYG
jgi:predicted nucleotidyltransferase